MLLIHLTTVLRLLTLCNNFIWLLNDLDDTLAIIGFTRSTNASSSNQSSSSLSRVK